MPQNITLAAFVLGAVLFLIALLRGGFKIFGAEIAGTTGSGGRVIAGITGTTLLMVGLWGAWEKTPAPPAPPSTKLDDPFKRMPVAPDTPRSSVNSEQRPLSAALTPPPPPSKHLPVVNISDITAQNTSRYLGNRTWQWTIFIASSPDILAHIQCVQYTLHESFHLPPQTVCTPGTQFAFSATGWGTFSIPIRVSLKDGTTIDIQHMLQFQQE